MKRFILSLLCAMSAFNSFAQDLDLERFYMPQPKSKEECVKYIGKKICVFDYDTSDKRWKDSYRLNEYRTDISFYTITKIKFGKQITLTLDNGRYTIKQAVNNGDFSQYGELSSCNVFFLWDEFEAYKKKLRGTVYKNENNEDVAVLLDIDLVFQMDKNPVLVSTLKSKLNNEEFICFSDVAQKLCNKIGTYVSHPKVKHQYKILSVDNKKPTDSKNLEIYAERPYYRLENTITSEITSASADNIGTSAFVEDMSGKYISLLAEVEKPANSDIRYGETTTIASEDGISKFSYKDNVIDILIFADRSNFNFVLQNVSESSIKIVWDEAVFVNFDGSTEKVMHKGIKYSEKNGSQPATTIIKNAKWEDSVTPTHLVYYREETKYLKGGWSTHSMYPNENGVNPGQVKLMLPIQVKDVINEYIFTFDVKYVFKYPERLNVEE